MAKGACVCGGGHAWLSTPKRGGGVEVRILLEC